MSVWHAVFKLNLTSQLPNHLTKKEERRITELEKQRSDRKAKEKSKLDMKCLYKLINAAAGADTLRLICPRRRFASFACIVTAAAVLLCTWGCEAFEPGEPRLSTDQRLPKGPIRISSLIACCTVTAGPLWKESLRNLILICAQIGIKTWKGSNCN